MAERGPKLAVLIDADNTSPKVADALFDEVAKFGEASLRRIYGDFSESRLRGWADILSRHAILPYQQFAYTTGKNSSDIALVIDAMDLVHSGRFDGFVLVSSDSDFTRLAARIREQGLEVYGIGQAKTPESFRQACSRFIFTENLGPAAAAATGGAAAAASGASEAVQPVREPPSAAIAMLRQAIEELEEDTDGWVLLPQVGQVIYNRVPDFDARTYGQPSLSRLVAATGFFDLDQGSRGLRIRIKPARQPKGGKT